MVRKNGQMKIQQMAFMLIAVTLFFALVAIFVIGFKFSGLKESAESLEEENAMLLASKLANSPEFSCGYSFDETKINCVDFDKLMALKGNPAYSDFWDVNNIEVRIIYPESEEIICSLENYPNCNVFRLYSKEVSGFDSSNFISLCRKILSNGKVQENCKLSKLIISYEGK